MFLLVGNHLRQTCCIVGRRLCGLYSLVDDKGACATWF